MVVYTNGALMLAAGASQRHTVAEGSKPGGGAPPKVGGPAPGPAKPAGMLLISIACTHSEQVPKCHMNAVRCAKQWCFTCLINIRDDQRDDELAGYWCGLSHTGI